MPCSQVVRCVSACSAVISDVLGWACPRSRIQVFQKVSWWQGSGQQRIGRALLRTAGSLRACLRLSALRSLASSSRALLNQTHAAGPLAASYLNLTTSLHPGHARILSSCTPCSLLVGLDRHCSTGGWQLQMRRSTALMLPPKSRGFFCYLGCGGTARACSIKGRQLAPEQGASGANSMGESQAAASQL